MRAKHLYKNRKSFTKFTGGIDEFYAYRHENHVYLMFDETDERPEWWSNLNIEQDYAGYHKGFRQAYFTLCGQLNDILIMGDNIHCIGFSRGGPFAIMCAYDFGGEAFVFGSPGFCNKKRAEEIKKRVKIISVVIRGDYITTVPLTYASCPYTEKIVRGNKIDWFKPWKAHDLHTSYFREDRKYG